MMNINLEALRKLAAANVGASQNARTGDWGQPSEHEHEGADYHNHGEESANNQDYSGWNGRCHDAHSSSKDGDEGGEEGDANDHHNDNESSVVSGKDTPESCHTSSLLTEATPPPTPPPRPMPPIPVKVMERAEQLGSSTSAKQQPQKNDVSSNYLSNSEDPETCVEVTQLPTAATNHPPAMTSSNEGGTDVASEQLSLPSEDTKDGGAGVSGSSTGVNVGSAATITADDINSTATAVSVYLRIRPPAKEGDDVDEITGQKAYVAGKSSTASSGSSSGSDHYTTVIATPPSNSRTSSRGAGGVKEFSFSKIFLGGTAQEDVYETTAKPLVEDLFQGVNGLLFAYGMTNAGKTFTTLGSSSQPGVLPRALKHLFDKAAATPGVSVNMSFLEIYNEYVYDLLAGKEESWSKTRVPLKLQDRLGKIEVKNLSKHPVKSAKEGLDLISLGSRNRAVASTQLNVDSSRSHSVCTVELQTEEGSGGAGAVGGGTTSGTTWGTAKSSSVHGATLWIVDLAGSERGNRTGASGTGTQQKEASNINLSLTVLWRCLQTMRNNQQQQASSPKGGAGAKAKQQVLPPFRDSKLTHLLMNHLSGASSGRTVMIVNINPAIADFDETQHVLSNSAIAKEVKTVKDTTATARSAQLLDYNQRLLRRKSKGGHRRSVGKKKASGLLQSQADRWAKKARASLAPPDQQTADGEDDEEADGNDVNDYDDDDMQHGGGGDYDDVDDEGQLSGAESDSALVDSRQSMVLMIENYEMENEQLKMTVRSLNHQVKDLSQQVQGAETAARQKLANEVAAEMTQVVAAYQLRLTQLDAAMRGAQAREAAWEKCPSKDLKEYCRQLEKTVQSNNDVMAAMEARHQQNLAEVEADFELFCEENQLNHPNCSIVIHHHNPTSNWSSRNSGGGGGGGGGGSGKVGGSRVSFGGPLIGGTGTVGGGGGGGGSSEEVHLVEQQLQLQRTQTIKLKEELRKSRIEVMKAKRETERARKMLRKSTAFTASMSNLAANGGGGGGGGVSTTATNGDNRGNGTSGGGAAANTTAGGGGGGAAAAANGASGGGAGGGGGANKKRPQPPPRTISTRSMSRTSMSSSTSSSTRTLGLARTGSNKGEAPPTPGRHPTALQGPVRHNYTASAPGDILRGGSQQQRGFSRSGSSENDKGSQNKNIDVEDDVRRDSDSTTATGGGAAGNDMVVDVGDDYDYGGGSGANQGGEETEESTIMKLDRIGNERLSDVACFKSHGSKLGLQAPRSPPPGSHATKGKRSIAGGGGTVVAISRRTSVRKSMGPGKKGKRLSTGPRSNNAGGGGGGAGRSNVPHSADWNASGTFNSAAANNILQQQPRGNQEEGFLTKVRGVVLRMTQPGQGGGGGASGHGGHGSGGSSSDSMSKNSPVKKMQKARAGLRPGKKGLADKDLA